MSGRFIFRRRDRDETVSFISVVGRVPTGNPLFFFPTAVILQTCAPLSKQLTVLCTLSDVETLNPMKRASSTHNFKNFRIVGDSASSTTKLEFSRICMCIEYAYCHGNIRRRTLSNPKVSIGESAFYCISQSPSRVSIVSVI